MQYQSPGATEFGYRAGALYRQSSIPAPTAEIRGAGRQALE